LIDRRPLAVLAGLDPHALLGPVAVPLLGERTELLVVSQPRRSRAGETSEGFEPSTPPAPERTSMVPTLSRSAHQ
jgi:hypothetical protein